MSYYEYLNEQSEMCREKAESVGDEKLSSFFENAAQGFKSRAGRLTIKEACGSKEEFEEEEKRRQEEAKDRKRGLLLEEIMQEALGGK